MSIQTSAQAYDLARFFKESDSSFGVFYPKHYIFATFPSFEATDQARLALRKNGYNEDDVLAVNGSETIHFFEAFHRQAGLWGGLMSEISRMFTTEEAFVDEDLDRARHGAGFLAVYSRTEQEAKRIRAIVAPFKPLAMHWYLPGAVQSLV